MTFHHIPAGRFRMGQRGKYANEEPVHWVEIPYNLWMAETPVTQEQFAAFDGNHENGFPDNPNHPLKNMTSNRAAEFCEWLAQFTDREVSSHIPQLPLEPEWEYACRARTTTEYHTGDGEDALDRAGWFVGNSKHTTHPVGEKEPNAFGPFDMPGNVWD